MYQEVDAMAEPIFMRIGEGNRIELPELENAIGNFRGILQDVDSAVSARKSGSLRWLVTTLADAPAPLIGVTPHLQRRAVNDTSFVVEREVINNFASLTERGERSRYLSDAALNKVEKIAKTAQKVGTTEIYTEKRGDLTLRTTVTSQTLNQVQELTQGKSLSYGTIVGSLDSISVHRGVEFRVWDENTKRPVTCVFKRERLSLVTNLLTKRVIVSGMIRCDRNGLPLRVSVDDLDGVAEDYLRPIGDLMGSVPNLLGGRSLKEYLEDSD
jgi:hypothetical protein